MDKSILLFVNPVSGNGKNVENSNFITQELIKENWQITLFISQQKDDFIKYLLNNEISKHTHIGIVGGDGSMHEVINGLGLNDFNLNISILLFPCGSGNALNHDLVCFTIEEALSRLKRNRSEKVDVIKVNAGSETHFAMSIVGFGIVNDINKRAESMRWMGNLRYTLAALVDIFRNPKYEAKVEVDGIKYDGNFCFVLISNTIHTGKAMKMAPLAQISDGLLDVLLVKHLKIWQLLLLFPKIFTGNHISSPLLKHFHAKSVNIYPKTPQVGNLDGEVKGVSPFEVEIMPKAIKIIC
jgi:YegS/Rv2252/BmrU family lipid kinase